MQTLRVIHRLDLRLIGVSGWRDCEVVVGDAESIIETTLGDNAWSDLVGETISCSSCSLVTMTKTILLRFIFRFTSYHPSNRSSHDPEVSVTNIQNNEIYFCCTSMFHLPYWYLTR